jgi:hypothetical protein
MNENGGKHANELRLSGRPPHIQIIGKLDDRPREDRAVDGA